MKTAEETLQELENLLDKLILGKPVRMSTDLEEYPEAFRPAIQKFEVLAKHLDEYQKFATHVSKGELTIDPPGRRNYITSPIKEIHSQLISFCYSIEQLIQGNMVSKLFYSGELFESYNSLIDKVSKTFSHIGSESGEEWGENISSWRYHQLLSALNQLHIMVIEVDNGGKVLFANPPAREVFGNFDEIPYGKEPQDDDSELWKYLCTFEKASPKYMNTCTFLQDFPVFNEVFDGNTSSWYKITSDRVNLADGTTGILHMIDDISERKRYELQLAHTASIDPLTSAYTRKAGSKKLDELIWLRNEFESCVAFVDIDDLKMINDRYGHTEGDFAISSIAEILISSVRKSDWVVRYGGDEFLILFSNCTKPLAEEVVERIYRKLEKTNETLEKPFKLHFSLGLSTIEPQMMTTHDVITVVDKKMYNIKAENKRKRLVEEKNNSTEVL